MSGGSYKQNLRPMNIHKKSHETLQDETVPRLILPAHISLSLSGFSLPFCDFFFPPWIFVFPCVEMFHGLTVSRQLICYNSTQACLGMILALTSLWRDKLVALWFQSMKSFFWTIGLLFRSPLTGQMELGVWALWTARVYPVSVQIWWQHPLIEDRNKCAWSWFCRI